jgi:hypothetical protein
MSDNPICEWCGETLGTYTVTEYGERHTVHTPFINSDDYLFCLPCDKEASNA